MPNVIVLSLSVNKISSLSDFSNCRGLVELYLRKNEIANLEDVYHLRKLPKLKILWLCDNPCATHYMYRPFVIRTLPQLEKLDNVDITPEERAECNKIPMSEFEAVTRSSPPPAAAPARQSNVPAQPAPRREGPDRSQRNIVTAVLALLNELTPSSLELIQQDIGARLQSDK
eukprot:TRINITY_DN13248_c0_g1_i2.p1 TRINITY_DN13248_c0_g1~~TRINITY_DN13248_c0_g1_i2.p1  ORF type:complete len:172 (+),score=25.76 TRINITY_DN13248_c0_g1_i2:61-576(+)